MSNLYLLVFLVFIATRISIDASLVEENISPKHWINAILTIIACTGLVLKNSRPEWFTIPFFLFTYQYLFDAGLNLEIGRSVQSTGKTAVTDRIERWILGNDESKFGMWFIMKTILFMGLIGSYFLNF